MSSELAERVRELRAAGRSPKQIARQLGMPPAAVAPLIRAVAAQRWESEGIGSVAGCWVSPGWSDGLTVRGHPDWPGQAVPKEAVSGLAAALVARFRDRGSVAVCGYLVDAYCLGVKNAVPPRVTSRHALGSLVERFFDGFDEPPVAAPLDLVQHLVLGAADYARGLGFEPHPDFAAARDHLGEWTGPSDIDFGRDGQPFYISGPYDNPYRVMATLERAVGRDNFHFLVPA